MGVLRVLWALTSWPPSAFSYSCPTRALCSSRTMRSLILELEKLLWRQVSAVLLTLHQLCVMPVLLSAYIHTLYTPVALCTWRKTNVYLLYQRKCKKHNQKKRARQKHSNSIRAAPTLNVQPRCSLCWLTEHRWEEVCSPLPLCCTFDMSPWDKWTAQLEGQSKWCAVLSGQQAWDAGKQHADRAVSFIAPHLPFFLCRPQVHEGRTP